MVDQKNHNNFEVWMNVDEIFDICNKSNGI